MKTFLECLHEAAGRGQTWRVYDMQKYFDEDDFILIQEAAEIYAEQSNSHKHSVVRGGVNEANTVSCTQNVDNSITLSKPLSTPTEPLPAEGLAQNGRGGCKHENIDRKDGLDECLDCGVKNY